MKLIGMFDSPFVRRVAIALRHYGMPFEHLDWSVGRDPRQPR
ncbi:MAG TPA: glutathione S-transferase N-terminal domain-containing protein [Steroidobacteraceae bacterium]|nr:glutathione S-transferase N-terminal domain-containing protein [Steroidobacteraceae bacterium]HQZ80794.1 glutathione S-transferase N-terminal domain-containing protein [Steroidobacteraceae bacterium]